MVKHGETCDCGSGRIAMHNAFFEEPKCMDCVANATNAALPDVAEMNAQLNPQGVEPRSDDPNWRDNIEAGEPMELAWRLLKGD